MKCDTERKRIQRAMRGRVINKDREIETEGRRRRSRQEILKRDTKTERKDRLTRDTKKK